MNINFSTFPILKTKRLILRQPVQSDAAALVPLIGDKDVAANLLVVPHPYTFDDAEDWFRFVQEVFDEGRGLNFAITLTNDGTYIGGIGLGFNHRDESAELGYWIGKPYWGNGYATEAAQAVLTFGFEECCLNRIFAGCFSHNENSANVLTKIGLKYEGRLRQHRKRWDQFMDEDRFGLISEEFFNASQG